MDSSGRPTSGNYQYGGRTTTQDWTAPQADLRHAGD